MSNAPTKTDTNITQRIHRPILDGIHLVETKAPEQRDLCFCRWHVHSTCHLQKQRSLCSGALVSTRWIPSSIGRCIRCVIFVSVFVGAFDILCQFETCLRRETEWAILARRLQRPRSRNMPVGYAARITGITSELSAATPKAVSRPARVPA